MTKASLNDRSFLRISGEDAEKFLENLITCKIEGLAHETLTFGALLTPQGKIMYDFFILKEPESYLFDLPNSLRDDFAKRLGFYKLRAKVTIEPVEDLKAYALWDDEAAQASGIDDPRSSGLGKRLYTTDEITDCDGNYLLHRIQCGIAQGGLDFSYGDAYPHEVLMDQNGGVDFKKGCYVGQEVVSRMHHRGTAKKRLVHIEATTSLPPHLTPILADGKPAGSIGSSFENHGLAILRLDRIASANQLTAGDVPISARLQDWVNFTLPETGKAQDGE